MTERTTVRLPDDLVRHAKRKAASEGRPLTALIEDGLRRVVNVGVPERKHTRILLAVSAAEGGLMPGIDLDDMAAQQDTEDLERAARLR